MPNFEVETEEITAFDFGDRYLFKKYFEEDQLFNQLKEYYKSDSYRFEIPEGDLEQVRQTFEDFFYELKIEGDVEDYLVVSKNRADSSEILRNSVMRKQSGQHEILLMKDELSVSQAVEQGAVHIEKSGVEAEVMEWKTNGS